MPESFLACSVMGGTGLGEWGVPMLHSCIVFPPGLDYQYPMEVIAKAVPTSFPELRNGSCVG